MKLLFFAVFSFFVFGGQAQVNQVPLKNMEGKTEFIQHKAKATVIFFLSPECPLCQSYTLTIKKLHQQFSSKGIVFIGVIPGTYFTLASIKEYKQTYNVPLKLLRDESKTLVNVLQAKVTPEVFVLLPSGKVAYSGRIDNWAYELTKKRKVITEHNLADALTAIVRCESVKVSKTKAIGCFIE
jgi:peroxiredoxin